MFCERRMLVKIGLSEMFWGIVCLLMVAYVLGMVNF